MLEYFSRAFSVWFIGMQTRPFLWASFVSIFIYAVVLTALINRGIGFFSEIPESK